MILVSSVYNPRNNFSGNFDSCLHSKFKIRCDIFHNNFIGTSCSTKSGEIGNRTRVYIKNQEVIKVSKLPKINSLQLGSFDICFGYLLTYCFWRKRTNCQRSFRKLFPRKTLSLDSPAGDLSGVSGSWRCRMSWRARSVPTSSERGHGTQAYCFLSRPGTGATRCLPRSAMRRLAPERSAAACRALIDKAKGAHRPAAFQCVQASSGINKYFIHQTKHPSSNLELIEEASR